MCQRHVQFQPASAHVIASVPVCIPHAATCRCSPALTSLASTSAIISLLLALLFSTANCRARSVASTASASFEGHGHGGRCPRGNAVDVRWLRTSNCVRVTINILGQARSQCVVLQNRQLCFVQLRRMCACMRGFPTLRLGWMCLTCSASKSSTRSAESSAANFGRTIFE